MREKEHQQWVVRFFLCQTKIPSTPGLCQRPPSSTEPAHPPAQNQKVEETRRQPNVVQWHLKNAYTKSADEKYLYSGDDTAQEQTLSSPNTNK